MKALLTAFMIVECAQSVIAATTAVPPGADLQAALNNAHSGDTLVLAAGATYVGNFYLPPNNGGQWITIQSSAMSSLPAAGSRVSPSNAGAMARVVTPNSGAALAMSTGAAFYRLQGIEFTPAAGIYVQDLIQVGNGGENWVGALPHDIDFDRDYIHGEHANGGKRGIALNGVNTTVENCYISGFFSTWQDTQALAGWNGPGPFQIQNNYLEAATETVAFGGAVPAIGGNIPSDILIQNNYFNKPLSWMPGSASYAGVPMWVKNHLELKNAQRVTIDSNTLENNWIGADQRGFMLVFTVRTEIGAVPWATVSDIKITNNRFRHSAGGMTISGHDDNPPGSGSSARFLVQNNSWEDISNTYGGDGRLFQFLGSQNVTIDHNTAFETGFDVVFDVAPSYGFTFTNNITNIGWGVAGDGAGYGTAALSTFAPGGTFLANVLIGGSFAQYPGGNYFPSSVNDVGFSDFAGGVFNLASNSPFKGAGSDGKDIGSSLPTSTVAAPPPVPTIPTGWVYLVSKNSGKCVDVSGLSVYPGTPIQQWGCWGGDNQKFLLTPYGSGYEITGKNSGLQLDIEGGPGVVWDGAVIVQWPFWGGSNEVFQVQPTADGYFTIAASSSGKCFDVQNLSKYDGAAIQQYGCWGGDNQKWSFVPAQ